MNRIHRLQALVVNRLLILLVVMFLWSCGQEHNSNAFDKSMRESLILSAKSIERNSQMHYHSLADKLTDPLTTEKARLWDPGVQAIQDLSKRMRDYILGLETDLKNEARISDTDSTITWKYNSDAVKYLFIRKGKAEELLGKLSQYSDKILKTDSSIAETFSRKLSVTSFGPNEKNEFANAYFNHRSVLGALAMLAQFENNISMAENTVVRFIDAKIYIDPFIIYEMSPLVAQNSTILKKGEYIEITAGVGAFSYRALPEITINGQTIPLEDNGTAVYKKTAPQVPGKYSIPVKISFTDQDGKNQIIEKSVKYIVKN